MNNRISTAKPIYLEVKKQVRIVTNSEKVKMTT